MACGVILLLEAIRGLSSGGFTRVSEFALGCPYPPPSYITSRTLSSEKYNKKRNGIGGIVVSDGMNRQTLEQFTIKEYAVHSGLSDATIRLWS